VEEIEGNKKGRKAKNIKRKKKKDNEETSNGGCPAASQVEGQCCLVRQC
jgi:hypothetical protein